ncbi:MAG TPA: PAS domain S-box protein [Chloroflexota bacterium]|nr:PAS domain S-box protein [Chloroflexota bacterium]
MHDPDRALGYRRSARSATLEAPRHDGHDPTVLQARLAQQALILAAAGEGIISLDAGGCITFANPAAAVMTGYALEGVLGQSLHALLHHHHADGTPYAERDCPILAVYQDRAVHRVSGEVFWRRDGASFPVEYVCSPMVEGDTVAGVVVLFRDISERLAVEARQRSLRQRAEAAEARFRTLVESAPDAIVITDGSGTIVLVNRQAEVTFGYARQALHGQPIEVLIPMPVRARHVALREGYYAHARTRPMGAGLDLSAQRQDGSTFPTEISLSPVQSDGELLVISVIRDISERRRAGEALRESEERFRLLVQDVKDYAIFLLTPEGNVASWNAGAQRLFGYDEAAIIGRHFSHFYLVGDVVGGKPATVLRTATIEGRSEDEGRRVRADGSEFWANTILTTLRDPDGRLRGFAKVTRDVTAQRELERQKDEFFANVSHDLRTPLGAITMAIGAVLANTPPDLEPRLRRLLVTIDLAASRMARLVDDLLELTRLQARRVQLRRARTDVVALARRAAGAIEPLAETKQQRLALELPKRSLWRDVDAERLERALVNLLGNAHKYGREGGLIQVRLRQEAGDLQISVSDDGPGIAPAEQARIFDRFYRAPGTAGNQGSGLGLPIARGLAELHGGRLDVESTPGRGSTFTITLPEVEATGAASAPKQRTAGKGVAG